MALIIEERAQVAWDATAVYAKEIGSYDKRPIEERDGSYGFTFVELEDYLKSYGLRMGAFGPEENTTRVRVTGKGWDLGPHGFNIVFESRQQDGTWRHFMTGGAVLHDGRWGVHT